MSLSEVVRTALARALRPAGGRDVPWAGIVREPGMVYGAELDEALAKDWAREPREQPAPKRPQAS